LVVLESVAELESAGVRVAGAVDAVAEEVLGGLASEAGAAVLGALEMVALVGRKA
jgi:hypothetical protein